MTALPVSGSVWERAARKLEGTLRSAKDSRTPGELAQALDARTVQTPALRLIDDHLVWVSATTGARLILSMPPQQGKSQRASLYFPLWLLVRNPDLRIAIASFEAGIARRWGRGIRNLIKAHPELGLKVREDTSAAHEWQLDGVHDAQCGCLNCPRDGRPYDGGVITVGIEGAITGRPVDILIVDDPVKDRRQADSETYRELAWTWWTDAARARLAPGAPVLLIMTRWHEDDLAGRLQDRDEAAWRVLNIPAMADHRPEKGETDPLGRDPGQYMESARGPGQVHDWEAVRISTPTTWASLYQGRPSPAEGVLLKRQFWQRYDAPRYTLQPDGTFLVLGADEVIQSWDMSFKDLKGSDFVVGQVWARTGIDAYLLAQVRGRMSFTATVAAVRKMTRDWPQARAKLVEDKANGTAVINHLQTEISGLIAVQVSDGKYARAVAVQPHVESGHVYLPGDNLAAWVQGFVDECATFPNSTFDDQVDAFTQAVDRLLGHPVKASTRRPPQRVPLPAGMGAALGGNTSGGMRSGFGH
jgi:predicted phage terminase large subunit-like protein